MRLINLEKDTILATFNVSGNNSSNKKYANCSSALVKTPLTFCIDKFFINCLRSEIKHITVTVVESQHRNHLPLLHGKGEFEHAPSDVKGCLLQVITYRTFADSIKNDMDLNQGLYIFKDSSWNIIRRPLVDKGFIVTGGEATTRHFFNPQSVRLNGYL